MAHACHTALPPVGRVQYERRKRGICGAIHGPGRKLGELSPVLRDLASPEAREELERAPDLPEVTEMISLDDGWSADLVEEDISKNVATKEDDVDDLGGMLNDPRFQLLPVHKLRKYHADQKEADKINKSSNRESARARKAARRTHKRLRIITGDFGGMQLRSPKSRKVRPMMERVRAAIFDMMLSQIGSTGRLPEDGRWLDLYAGTGSVGLEALSRGCGECHFIELDPWVTTSVLRENIKECSCESRSVTHMMRAEDYLKRSAQRRSFGGGTFDFISVCPPYLQVSYPELQDLLVASAALGEDTLMFMEYPRQLAHEIRDTLGPLTKVKDRRYGRTWLAVYKAV